MENSLENKQILLEDQVKKLNSQTKLMIEFISLLVGMPTGAIVGVLIRALSGWSDDWRLPSYLLGGLFSLLVFWLVRILFKSKKLKSLFIWFPVLLFTIAITSVSSATFEMKINLDTSKKCTTTTHVRDSTGMITKTTTITTQPCS